MLERVWRKGNALALCGNANWNIHCGRWYESEVKVKITQLCPTLRSHGLQPTRLLCHGIFQARVLECVAIAFSICLHVTQQSHCWEYTSRKPELKDTCTPMFIAALFAIAKTWKQPRCSSTDGWIRKLWYTYTMEYYSGIKKCIWVSSNEVDGTEANVRYFEHSLALPWNGNLLQYSYLESPMDGGAC